MKQRFKNYAKPKSFQSRGVSNPPKNSNLNKLETRNKNDIQKFIDKNKTLCEKMSQLNAKNRAMVRDTLIEDQRKGNFVRIYP